MNGETSSIPTGTFFPLLGNEGGDGLCHHQHHPRPFQPNTVGDGDRIDVRDAIDGDLQPGACPNNHNYFPTGCRNSVVTGI
ncbi:hypothetical protein AAC387_Pa07g1384 [Persea americana]